MRCRLLPALLLVSLGFGPVALQSQIITWAGTGDRFVTGSNWVGGVAPGPSNTAQFGPDGGFFTVLVNPTSVANLSFINTRTAGYILDYDDGIALLTLGGNVTVQAGPNVIFTSNLDIVSTSR